MKQLVSAMLAALFAVNLVYAQAPASECESKAVDKNGKPLAGAAKGSFMKKCEADAKKTSCEAKALDKHGKALAGAARKSFMKKCQAES